ncbi:MAG: TetR/AcrR family transcriptional regulator [Clostridia bacterium]|nr:TetR/AcrR family transcriptional regulator [Clostridia bacterium]
MDPRYVRKDAAIKKATIELLKDKSIGEIKICELCKKANVNRNTFYAHYKSPIEVVETISRDFLQEFENIVKALTDRREVYVEICRYIFERREVFSMLITANVENRYLKIALDSARSNARSGFWGETHNKLTEYKSEFLIGGYYFVLMHWVETGAKESPEEIGKMLYELMKNSQ